MTKTAPKGWAGVVLIPHGEEQTMMRWRIGTLLTLGIISLTIAANAASDVIFDEQANARHQIRAALAQASRTRKNIVLDFGANWCGDCHALEARMQTPELAALIAKNYVVVNVDVGRFDKNLDLAEKYGVPLKKGIPALAVLDSHGKLLYAQDQGQFESARQLGYESFLEFFEKWKPKR